MEIGAGATNTSGRATDALEAIIRRLRASAARPPPPLRCALARTPNNPCYREALEAVCAARPGVLSAIRDSPLRALAQGRQNHGGTESCREKDPGGQSSMILSGHDSVVSGCGFAVLCSLWLANSCLWDQGLGKGWLPAFPRFPPLSGCRAELLLESPLAKRAESGSSKSVDSDACLLVFHSQPTAA